MNAPIIGLTTYGRHERDLANEYYDKFFLVPADYVDAVRRAGGVPILLPPGETNWQRWIEITDGIVVTGGSDIDPRRYGGNPDHPNLTRIDVERDETELSLTKALAAEQSKPTLYICRGMQVLNVAMGGTLTEHIPDIMDDDIHRNDAGYWEDQPLSVESDSQLAAVMGATEVTTTSGHHQAVKAVGERLNVVARAADGIIEALQLSDHPWALAVQWHPEKTAHIDSTQQALFDELVATARLCMHDRNRDQAEINADPRAGTLLNEDLVAYRRRWDLVSQQRTQERR